MFKPDFLRIVVSSDKAGRGKENNSVTISPSFLYVDSKDLLVKGGGFYGIWDADNEIWSRNILRAVDIIDECVRDACKRYDAHMTVKPKFLKDSNSKIMTEFLTYMKNMPSTEIDLDTRVRFKGDKCTREDYSSRRLDYSPSQKVSIEKYDYLMNTLYAESERQKIEWFIGAMLEGHNVDLQKFLVLYGSAGTGKSTVLKIIERLFRGYSSVFSAKKLTSSSDFAASAFDTNPVVALDHDGDLSRISDNTKLNSIVSHDRLMINQKFLAEYSMVPTSGLIVATNSRVRVTEAKSGIMRRLIDAEPTGMILPPLEYDECMRDIPAEIPGIAAHCMAVFEDLGINAYDSYRPIEMMSSTNDFFAFMEDICDRIANQEYTTLQQLWTLYKQYAENAKIPYPMSLRAVKDEAMNYFEDFEPRYWDPNIQQKVRSAYFGLKRELFRYEDRRQRRITATTPRPKLKSLRLLPIDSLLDRMLESYPAQYATKDGIPKQPWDKVDTVLKDIDTSKLHYVKVPENYIVLDFDLKDENGEKSLEKNLEAASAYPLTYAELSQSEQGVHLHYIYDGDPTELAKEVSPGIEIKVYSGKSALRRKLTLCNNAPVLTISTGLPLREKGGKQLLDFKGFKNEKALRRMIEKNLRKEVHGATKPSIDFIAKCLDEAYSQGLKYDVTDLRPAVKAFAANSTNQALYCIKVADKMKYKSEEEVADVDWDAGESEYWFYDVEVFPNLFVICFKQRGSKEIIDWIQPSVAQVEELCRHKLIGFNNRKYDNHILMAWMMGYNNQQLYSLSRRIINSRHAKNEEDRNCYIRNAFNLAYADIYDYSSKKQSLKKWEIELGIHHQELGLPWDEPVDESMWGQVATYCKYDVSATEAVFEHTIEDFHARELLSALSGLPVSATNRLHTTRIIFGGDKHPQDQFVYTDLSKDFPGYVFDHGKSTYRGVEVGEGGYVYAEHGMYEHVALLDISSMHPSSIIALNLFGDKYTQVFKDLLDARIAVKHRDRDSASKLLDGKLLEFWSDDDSEMDAMAYALKIIINSVYGLTKASFDCEFRDPRNVDNIVAKRGALFMVNLLNEVQARGFTVAHIKTDSIKIPNATPEIIEFVTEYGKKYGYNFEHEATFEKYCLTTNADYICKVEYGREHNAGPGEWSATGARFSNPYVFKTLFSKEPVDFLDMTVTINVSSPAELYLDMNEDLPEGEHNYQFVGRVGRFSPILPGRGGGELMAKRGDTYSSPSGTKGYRWMETEMVQSMNREADVDESYYKTKAQEAIDIISKYGDFDKFVA